MRRTLLAASLWLAALACTSTYLVAIDQYGQVWPFARMAALLWGGLVLGGAATAAGAWARRPGLVLLSGGGLVVLLIGWLECWWPPMQRASGLVWQWLYAWVYA